MFLFDQQSATELEFDKIKTLLQDFCIAETSRGTVKLLQPYQTLSEVDRELGLTSEFMKIKNSPDRVLPRLDFHDLSSEIKKLKIEGYILPSEAFIKLLNNSYLCNELIRFMEEYDGQYPYLYRIFRRIESSDIIIKNIEEVFDKKMNIKNDASDELMRIRTSIRSTKREINRNFEQIIRKLQAKGYLGDTKETFIDERRVLTIISTYKRKVPGNVLGVSKTGGFSYIEPSANIESNKSLMNLFSNERDEILKILKDLTTKIRLELPLIKTCQKLLNRLDFIQAKYKLAESMQGIKPKYVEEPYVDIINAIHPLLFLNNAKEGKPTYPQSIKMDRDNHFLVISGPNAGGKSITLKTVGLLQLMFQSGLLVPAHPKSTFGWFNQILSDIGDNQSIENQLSTYSYRLNRMNQFLNEGDNKSLLLLDEFGSGSDPELGGALAEAIFESLYKKRMFAVLTTHYANIKLQASELERAINACMLFDQITLAPTFTLSIGQPGSSFTFEVAQMNGIPDSIIQRAKSKLSLERVQMDKLIATLQIEKTVYERRNQSLKDKASHSTRAKEDYELLSEKIKQQKISQQEFVQMNNHFIIAGKKMSQFVSKYKPGKNNKALLVELTKYLAIEKSKFKKDNIQKMNKRLKQSKLKQIKQKVTKTEKSVKELQKPIIIGDSVIIVKTKQKGIVKSIENDKCFIIVGNFLFQTKKDDLIHS